MTENKDGFVVGSRLESDDLLKHEAKMRQEAKANPKKLNDIDHLNEFIRNKLQLQKVTIKPLALEQLSKDLVEYFKPAKKAVKKA